MEKLSYSSNTLKGMRTPVELTPLPEAVLKRIKELGISTKRTKQGGHRKREYSHDTWKELHSLSTEFNHLPEDLLKNMKKMAITTKRRNRRVTRVSGDVVRKIEVIITHPIDYSISKHHQRCQGQSTESNVDRSNLTLVKCHSPSVLLVNESVL